MRKFLAAIGVLACASFAFCDAGSAQEALSSPQQQALTAEQQAEIAAVEANAALVATPGEWLAGPEAVYPDEERALGHHGRAEVRGLLGLDGRLRYATVSRSSRAPGLDASALAAALAGEYRPAHDASGNPVLSIITVSRSFYSFTSSEGVGAAMYTCRQFVLDMEWWKTTWADEGLGNHYFYVLIRGLGAIARMGAGGPLSVESNESYATRWDRAIESCRRRPERRFADAMKPEGDYIDRMAARYRAGSR